MDKKKPHLQFVDQNDGTVLLERWFNPSQLKFWNSKAQFIVLNGGYCSGKTEPLILKTIYDAMTNPDNYILMGRKTYQEIYDVLLKDFLTLCPPAFIKKFTKSPHPSIELYCPGSNKTSEIIFRNLDKFAEQEIKGLNLGGISIDQAEDIPEEVFRALTFRLRRKNCPLKVYMTVNPALNWLYKKVKHLDEKDREAAFAGQKWEVIEAPSTENYHNVSQTTVNLYESYKITDPAYYRQYVLGVWDESLMAENIVFAREHINRLQKYIEQSKNELEGLEIFREPIAGRRYQMGVDCAEGSQHGDFSAASIVDLDSLEEVASWAGKIPPEEVANKAVFWAEYYSKGYPQLLMNPEINAMGFAFLNRAKELGWTNFYQREEYDKKSGRKTKQLGWRTTAQTKPLLISNFRHLLRTVDPIVRTKATIKEMSSFIFSNVAEQKGAGAEVGFHDDRIIALLLAFWEKDRRSKESVIVRQSGGKGMPVAVNVAYDFKVVNGKMKMLNLPKEERELSWKVN